MSIQYAGGTIVNATLTQSSGTRAELAQWIRDQLGVAGWASSGSATDYQLTSATTPQSLQGRVRVYDPGSGSCARLRWSNTAGTKVQVGDLFLLPAASKSWRIVANKYQFFVTTPGSPAAREFACGGIPYLPPFLNGVITECIWAHGNAISDTGTAVMSSFRTALHTRTPSSAPNQFGLVNGNILENNGNVNFGITNGYANMRFLAPVSGFTDDAAGSTYRWHDLSQIISDPLISWGGTNATDEGLIRGQIWDAALLSDAWAGDTTLQVDPSNPSYNFITVTNNATGNGSEARGTLCVRTS